MTNSKVPSTDAEAPSETSEEPRKETRTTRKKVWKRFRHSVVFYLGIYPANLFLSYLPFALARLLGRALGTGAYLLRGEERRIGLENLRQAFPERDERELRRICRQSFQNAAMTMTETLALRRWSADKIEARFGLGESIRRFDEALAGGGIGTTAHFGNWEVLGAALGLYLPGRVTVAARRSSNERFHEHLHRFRKSFGVDTIYNDESPREFIRVLRDGKILGVLPDQNLRTPNGVFVSFFGRPAYTSTLPVHLNRSTKTTNAVFLLAREGRGFRPILHTDVLSPWTDDREEDLRVNTERVTKILEEEFRKLPEQWVWFHDRWRTQPGDEKEFQNPVFLRKRRRR